MKTQARVALFVGGFLAHLALTLVSVSHMIGCGDAAQGCVTTVDRVWNQVVGFPIFSVMELFHWLSPGSHSSGLLLTILIPVNSLAFMTIVYLLLTKFVGPKAVRKKTMGPA